MYIRLQKALSEYGIMSRRAAESLIDQGRIKGTPKEKSCKAVVYQRNADDSYVVVFTRCQ